MARKSRPLKSQKGDLFREIDQRIMEHELMKDEISQEIRRYMMMLQRNDGGNIRGIDYSKDKVVGGSMRVDFQTAIQKIDGLQANLNNVIDMISELKEKREKLVEIYRRDQTSIEAKVFYYREILQYSQEMTAVRIGYSVRQIQRIEKKIKEEYCVRI